VKQAPNRSSTQTAEELLGQLGFRAEEMAALARQGSVSLEIRLRKGVPAGPYYKLRWRQQGRQRVKYLGCDPARASAVRAALLQLQASRRQAREVRRGFKQIRAYWAAQKQVLQLLLGPGFYFHGYCIRQRRRAQPSLAFQGGQADSVAVQAQDPTRERQTSLAPPTPTAAAPAPLLAGAWRPVITFQPLALTMAKRRQPAVPIGKSNLVTRAACLLRRARAAAGRRGWFAARRRRLTPLHRSKLAARAPPRLSVPAAPARRARATGQPPRLRLAPDRPPWPTWSKTTPGNAAHGGRCHAPEAKNSKSVTQRPPAVRVLPGDIARSTAKPVTAAWLPCSLSELTWKQTRKRADHAWASAAALEYCGDRAAESGRQDVDNTVGVPSAIRCRKLLQEPGPAVGLPALRDCVLEIWRPQQTTKTVHPLAFSPDGKVLPLALTKKTARRPPAWSSSGTRRPDESRPHFRSPTRLRCSRHRPSTSNPDVTI
jgi:hypothetical protein